MRVIGTAGHVDHGKSTLVLALTGTHPDRLKEEREREMTIDLGFAWMSLPSGEEVGIVDVPGHRDFIENMLAGVAGIDAALFVVAADEGVMPQTREHLAILDILEIQGGVVALTKIDLLEDPEWLDLVEEDVRQELSGTAMESANIVRVSARTGQGIPQLHQAIGQCLAEQPARPDIGRPRLPVDRVFTIAGFGTIVTGTLSDGQLRVGDEIEVLPHALRGRVRGLQTHKRKEEVAIPGSRTAVNISGMTVDQVQRGDVIARPGDYSPTRRLDVQFRLLQGASQPVSHNMQVKFFLGAAEVVARLRLLGKEVLRPGETGWLQLELREPVTALRGDRYILRRPSPGETLGGGIVVDPHPKGRHRRFSERIMSGLEALVKGNPVEILMQAVAALGAAPIREVIMHSSLEPAVAATALDQAVASGNLLLLEAPQIPISVSSDLLVSSQVYWLALAARINQELKTYHQSNPLRRGMPREELKSRLKISTRLYNAALQKLLSENALAEAGAFVRLPGHQVRFTAQQERSVNNLLERFAASPYAPPSFKEAQAEVGDDIINALLELGILVAVSPEVVFRREDFDRMVAEVRRLLEGDGRLSAAQARDHFNTSRRYVLAFLEHLDALGVTVREGDVRRLKGSR